MSGLNQDPISFSEAMSRTNSKKWSDAMKDELNSMANNQVWDLVELPEGFRAVAASGSIRPKLMHLITSKDIRQDLLPRVSFKMRALIIMKPSLQFLRMIH